MRVTIIGTIIVCLAALQPSEALSQSSSMELSKSSMKISNIFSKLEDSVQKQFEQMKLSWPPQSIYIRSFKYDRQLEVWVRGQNQNEPYKLFKTYKVCMQSGTMGPKRMQGDYQVPEGFYHINEFNPNSNYHLSLGLNYPNASDRILSDSLRPGNAIYIHGNCVSTGCIAISDAPIEELYYIASNARSEGQEFIPVHVFPVRYNVKKSLDYLENMMRDNTPLKEFNRNIRNVYDYFETRRQLPVILVNRKGEYVMN